MISAFVVSLVLQLPWASTTTSPSTSHTSCLITVAVTTVVGCRHLPYQTGAAGDARRVSTGARGRRVPAGRQSPRKHLM